MNKIKCVKCGCVINTNAVYYSSFNGSFCRECLIKQSDKFKSERLVKALEKRFKGNINNNLFKNGTVFRLTKRDFNLW